MEMDALPSWLFIIIIHTVRCQVGTLGILVTKDCCVA